MAVDLYYKYNHYIRGERYFRMTSGDSKVITVIVSEGCNAQGRGKCPSIRVMNKTTVLTNYFGYKNFEEITKKEYNKAFDDVVKLLK